MKTEIILKDDTITLPRALYDKLTIADENELRVLLTVACEQNASNDFDTQKCADALGISINDVENALQFWRGAGIIKTSGKKSISAKTAPSAKNDIPNYSGEQINTLFEQHAELSKLIEECQKIAGKTFNPFEINKVVAMYDYLGVSAAFILTVFAYCASKNKTTIHYIEKTVYNLYDEGIDTEEKLEVYLQHKEKRDSVFGAIRSIFGMGSRSLTAREKSCFEIWTEKWSFSLDIIKRAYEITVNSTAKPSVSYANKILENWHNAGLTTLEQIDDANNSFRSSKKQSTSGKAESFDTDEFFDASLRKSYENIGKIPDNH